MLASTEAILAVEPRHRTATPILHRHVNTIACGGCIREWLQGNKISGALGSTCLLIESKVIVVGGGIKFSFVMVAHIVKFVMTNGII